MIIESEQKKEVPQRISAKVKLNWKSFLSNVKNRTPQEISDILKKKKSQLEFSDPEPKILDENRVALKNINILQLTQNCSASASRQCMCVFHTCHGEE